MNPFRRIATWTLVAVLSVASSGCASARLHPDFGERHKKMRSVGILPAEIEAYKDTFSAGNQLFPEVAEAMRKGTDKEINKVFTDKGYEVKDMRLTESDLKNDETTRQALHEINGLYKKALEDIAKNKQKSFTYSVGSAANHFADRAEVNALVLVRETAFKKTGGQMAADVTNSILVGVATLGAFVPAIKGSKIVIEVAIIDPDLGDVLWYNAQFFENVDPQKEDTAGKLIKSIFSSFPKSAFKPAEIKTDVALKEVKKATKTANFSSKGASAPMVLAYRTQSNREALEVTN